MTDTANMSAYDVLTQASEAELADIFFQHTHDDRAKRAAHKVVKLRNKGRLPHTLSEFRDIFGPLLAPLSFRTKT